jgi:polygalacturonase
VLATGCDDLSIRRLRIDTNRDGLDIDGCRDVTIADCRVNTPNDDAIVLKSSLALGEVRSTERVEITRCHVSGFDLGTMLDGTEGRSQQLAPDQDRVTGRIKLGTESNGDFRHITISDCVFTRSRGLALETVDGGTIEDVSIDNIVLREVTTAPLFLRLGERGADPTGRRAGPSGGSACAI